MAIHKPCPRCQTPLEIPQPAPDQIRCNKCGTIIKNRIVSSAKHEPVTPATPVPIAAPALQPAPSVSRPNRMLLAGLVGGLLLVCMLPIAGLGLAWVFSGTEKKTPDEPMAPDVVKVEDPILEKPKPPPPPDPRIKIVQPAVDMGVAFLKAKVPEIASQRAAFAGLAGLTLLECGVPKDDPAILKMAETIRAAAPRMNTIYDLSASLFFLNRWDEAQPLDDKDRKLARTFALRIIAGQGRNGIWGYGGVIMAPEQEAKLLTSLQDGTYQPAEGGGNSMSNTQFAMLAVWGSRKHGLPVREPLLALAAYFHANQRPDGSWNYPGERLTATGTCAGLIGLAIERGLLDDKEFRVRHRGSDVNKKMADLDKAFKYLGKSIGRKKGDPFGGGYRGGSLFDADSWGDLYFLWTLERVGVIYSTDRIDGKEWYDWGYPFALNAQLHPAGYWNDNHDPLADTCFALLFLKRSNIARDLTEIIRTRGGKTALP